MKKITGFLAVVLLMFSLTCIFSACSQKQVSITFVQHDGTSIVKTIGVGENLSDIPVPLEKAGYSVAWDKIDFTNLQKNLTVKAVLTPNRYTITYEISAFETIEKTSQTVVFGQEFNLQTPTHQLPNVEFICWIIKGQDSSLSDGVYNIVGNVTLVAKWQVVSGGEWSPNA